MSVDSTDKPPKPVLLSGLLSDVLNAITVDEFITIKITDRSRMNISNDIFSLECYDINNFQKSNLSF
jgi:hypothetical protein